LSTEIEITLHATDEASSVIADAGRQITESTDAVADANSGLGSAVDAADETLVESGQAEETAGAAMVSTTVDAEGEVTALEGVGTASQGSSMGLQNSVVAMNSAALSGATLYMAVDRVENSQVALDRANLNVQKSTNSVQSAQEAYNSALASGDPQKTADALAKLQTAQDSLSVAQERVGVAERSNQSAWIMSALTVIPSVVAIIGVLTSMQEAGTLAKIASTVASGAESAAQWAQVLATEAATAATAALDAVMDANPIMLVVLAIAAITAALIYAYNVCPPFRDAINEIGKVLGGDLATAFNDVKDALEYLWNNVLVPVSNFLTGTFQSAINIVMAVLKPLIDGINTVVNVGSSIGGVVGGALKTIGLAEGGIVTQPTFALIGEAGPEAVIPLSGSNSSIFGLQGVSPLDMSPVSGGGNSPGAASGQPDVINVYVTNYIQTEADYDVASQHTIESLNEALARRRVS
jgi:hypothetical protein